VGSISEKSQKCECELICECEFQFALPALDYRREDGRKKLATLVPIDRFWLALSESTYHYPKSTVCSDARKDRAFDLGFEFVKF
jgi:hypothetical protein